MPAPRRARLLGLWHVACLPSERSFVRRPSAFGRRTVRPANTVGDGLARVRIPSRPPALRLVENPVDFVLRRSLELQDSQPDDAPAAPSVRSHALGVSPCCAVAGHAHALPACVDPVWNRPRRMSSRRIPNSSISALNRVTILSPASFPTGSLPFSAWITNGQDTPMASAKSFCDRSSPSRRAISGRFGRR